MNSRIALAATVATCLFSHAVAPAGGALLAQQGFGPGQRVMLDAHNAYPQNDRWRDRIDRALSTGFPVAIEQDLYWRKDRDGVSRSSSRTTNPSSIARRHSTHIFSSGSGRSWNARSRSRDATRGR